MREVLGVSDDESVREYDVASVSVGAAEPDDVRLVVGEGVVDTDAIGETDALTWRVAVASSVPEAVVVAVAVLRTDSVGDGSCDADALRVADEVAVVDAATV